LPSADCRLPGFETRNWKLECRLQQENFKKEIGIENRKGATPASRDEFRVSLFIVSIINRKSAMRSRTWGMSVALLTDFLREAQRISEIV
jgi:hypothetical protein